MNRAGVADGPEHWCCVPSKADELGAVPHVVPSARKLLVADDRDTHRVGCGLTSVRLPVSPTTWG